MENNQSFSGFSLKHGLVHENIKGNDFPSVLHGFEADKIFEFANPTSTYFGFVLGGNPNLNYSDLQIPIKKGMYFCIPGDGLSSIIGGFGMIVEKLDYYGVFSVGGPLESTGRLKYIDGCTDSLLIPPVKLGDACFNGLFFPAGINQTQHTHPSDRVGLVFKGQGTCITPYGNIDLIEGMLFIIHQNGLHSFRTDKGTELIVLAFHPESDFGPKDEDHPMMNRTIVNGVSAKNIDNIRTK